MVERYVSRYWLGEPFEIFNLGHLISLVIIIVFCLCLIQYRNRPSKDIKLVIRYTLAGFLIISQLSFMLWLFYIGEASLKTILPLHLCSLFTFISAYMLIRPSDTIFQYCYYLGTGGSLVALITPDVGSFNFPHFLAIQTMIAHGCLLMAQMYMVSVEGYRPKLNYLWKIYLSLLIYSILVIQINALTGGNYMFFSYKPDFPTILDYFGPWPWYIPITIAGIYLGCFLLYIPFHLHFHYQQSKLQK